MVLDHCRRRCNSPGYTSRASQWGALFIASVIALILVLVVAPLALHSGSAWAVDGVAACAADRIDARVRVKAVVDGDTLRLADERLVRLVGINSPEIGRDGAADEPQAREARQALEALVMPQRQIGLRFGSDSRDRYDRLLAHVFLDNGSSVAASLLRSGMAAHIVVPPNDWNLECYRAAEAQARVGGRGVWSSIYRSVPVEQLPSEARGFRFIQGRVVHVGQSRDALWLNFNAPVKGEPFRGVALRITRADLAYFPGWDAQQLIGQTIEARGWLQPVKQQLVMQVRHPAALQVVR